MRTPKLFVAKFKIFRKLWCVRTDIGGGGVTFFAILYELLLRAAPFYKEVIYIHQNFQSTG